MCQNCLIVRDCYKKLEYSRTRVIKEHYMHQMEPLLNVRCQMEVKNGEIINVKFTKEGNEHLYSDTFRKFSILRKEDLKELDKLLQEATFIDDAECNDPAKIVRGYKHFYYYEAKLHERRARLNVAKRTVKGEDGRWETEFFLYSINEIKN